MILSIVEIILEYMRWRESISVYGKEVRISTCLFHVPLVPFGSFARWALIQHSPKCQNGCPSTPVLLGLPGPAGPAGPASGKADFAGLLLGPAANIQESNPRIQSSSWKVQTCVAHPLQNCCCRSYPVLLLPQFSPWWCLTHPPLRTFQDSRPKNPKRALRVMRSWVLFDHSCDPFTASTLQKLTYKKNCQGMVGCTPTNVSLWEIPIWALYRSI